MFNIQEGRPCSRDLMSEEDCMAVPVLITVLILGKNKVRTILEARERQRQEMREDPRKRKVKLGND